MKARERKQQRYRNVAAQLGQPVAFADVLQPCEDSLKPATFAMLREVFETAAANATAQRERAALQKIGADATMAMIVAEIRASERPGTAARRLIDESYQAGPETVALLLVAGARAILCSADADEASAARCH